MTLRFPRLSKALPALAFAAALGYAAPPAHADAPSLQLAPLQYTDSLKAGVVSSGFVDVSNPSDSPVQITSKVRGFRQTGTGGDLQFFDDPDLTAGIKVDLATFTLGPREAVRVVFSVDPSKLPQGGIYAAVFFRTNPVNQANAGTSFVAQSANVGTLLILTNGGPGAHRGNITGLSLPFWQFGPGLHGGDLTYQNTDTSKVAVAFKPVLSTSVLPWGRSAKFTTGLVLPGVTRKFDFDRPGTYFGLLPVTVSDSETGHHATVWVFAATGAAPWLLLLLAALGIVAWRYRAMLRAALRRLVTWLKPAVKRMLQPKLEPEPTFEPAPEPEVSSEPEPEPVSSEPEPEQTTASEVADLLTQAEAPSPDPGTLVMPEVEGAAPKPKPKAPAKKPAAAEPKPARVHKVNVQSKDTAKKRRPRK